MVQRELDLPAMRKIATGTLIVLVVVFFSTFLDQSPGWAMKLLRAAAGAGIVGALADWFAVVALFRRPLGLPIPHTALLPRNQQRVAVNVGRFIEENFLQTDLILQKLRESEVTEKAASWLLKEGHSDYLVQRLLQSLVQILRADMPEAVEKSIGSLIRKLVGDAAGNPKVAQELSTLLQHGLKGDTLTEIVLFLRKTVEENRDAVARLVRDNSRWWIATRLDRNASDLIVNGLLSVLNDMAQPDSKLREEFEEAAVAVLRDFTDMDHLLHVIENTAADYANSKRFERNMRNLITNMKSTLADYLESDEAIKAIQSSVQEMVERLSTDKDLQQRTDAAISELLEKIIPEIRPYVGSFVAQTIAGWDPDLLVERFETEAGRDLQFIRINGALLGFAIGGLLFCAEQLVG